VPLQTLPSPHEVPFNTGALMQPKIAAHESVVQGLLSLQLSGLPAVQVPDWHVSAPSQTVVFAHVVPFGSAGFWHPRTGLQVSLVHTLPSLQLRAVPAVQAPF
jgi:hypothetical protein